MILKIEELKKSDRGIEVTGWVPDPHRDTVIGPDIPYNASKDEGEVMSNRYKAQLHEIAAKYDDDQFEFKLLHLGNADLVQEKRRI